MKTGLVWLRNAFGARRGVAVANAYRALFAGGGGEGRLVLDDLARYCRAGATSFVANDPHQTAFNEGARDVFLHVAELAGLDPSAIADYFIPSSDKETDR
jgi:hypothetical protein